VRVTSVTGDTLLKLIGGQVRHKLSEYSLADIHPSLSANAIPVSAQAVLGGIRLETVQIEESTISSNPLIPWVICAQENF
jgi:hypothetical protein